MRAVLFSELQTSNLGLERLQKGGETREEVVKAGHTRSNIVAGNCCGQQSCQRLDFLSVHEQLLPAMPQLLTIHKATFFVGNSCQQQRCFAYGPLKVGRRGRGQGTLTCILCVTYMYKYNYTKIMLSTHFII